MKTSFKLICILSCSFFAINCYSQEHQVRIGFFGNSLSVGWHLPNPSEECYPAQLDDMLTGIYGDTVVVKIFAVSGRTMLKKGDHPIWDEKLFAEGWAYAPDICFILLGSNDTKPQNWNNYGNEFFDDYLSMIDTFKIRNPRTKFIVSYPPRVFETTYGISDFVIVNGVIPAIDSIIKVRDAILMDFYHLLYDSAALFPDNVHPSVQGAKVMAELILSKLIETDIIHQVEAGYPYVTSFESNTKIAEAFDSVTLSWTSINADSVKLNDQVVPVNGSKKVTNSEDTSYSLIAYNEKGTDTLVIDQVFYTPEVARITIYPSLSNLVVGDSVLLEIKYYDQYNKVMQDNPPAVSWEIKEGEGSLVNITNSTALFVCTNEGDITIVANFGDLSATSKITVSLNTNIKQETLLKKINIFTNPIGENINISLENFSKASVKVRLYSIPGQLIVEKNYKSTDITNKLIVFNGENIPDGIYIVEVEANNKKSPSNYL